MVEREWSNLRKVSVQGVDADPRVAMRTDKGHREHQKTKGTKNTKVSVMVIQDIELQPGKKNLARAQKQRMKVRETMRW